MSGKVVALWGGKGGVGCTLVAAGLAAAWHRQGRAVGLIQLDGESADETELLLEKAELPYLMPKDRIGGPLSLEQLLASLGPEGRLVVDCAFRQEPVLRQVVAVADAVIIVGTPDLLGLRCLTRARQRVMDHGVGERRVGLVLNRSGMAGGIAVEEAQAAVGAGCWGVLPEAPEEVTAMVTRGLRAWRGGAWTAALEALAVRTEQTLRALPLLPRPAWHDGTARKEPPSLAVQVKQEALQKLVRRLGGVARPDNPWAFRRRVTEEATSVVEELAEAQRLPRRDVGELVLQLVDEVVGLGALEDLIKDPEVTEIMINGPDQVYIEKGGQLRQVPCQFASPDEIIRLVDRIIGPLGRRIDESSPMVDARLPDGSRLNAVIPPLALDGPLVTIRRFGVRGLAMEDLVTAGTLTLQLAKALGRAVAERKNILLSGGTGTGKTTLLNALSRFIPGVERIITIEDAAELRLQQRHVVRLEARPPNVEGQGAVTIRDLVRNALRMRPDRIIVGEVRGAEALDMLQAMNTGHSGSMATIHANSARDALSRLETMVLMANLALPLKVVREQVAAAIDLVIHLERHPGGGRRVSEVIQLSGLAGGRYLARPWAVEKGEDTELEAAEA
ncbi:MAG: ATPase, T2SS/T4P/T4SS family [Betaproteobacteria bacterium]